MPLKKMSYDSADKIIDLYAGLLANLPELRGHEKYGYSAMKGYDIVDVSNAIKLMIAYRFFNDEADIELNKYISVAESALSGYDGSFYPDGIAHGLSQIDLTDPRQAILEDIKLTRGSEHFDWNKLIKPQEIPSSFFNYCQRIGNKHPEFWERVYLRIGITWETNNEKDRIYFIIKHKELFIKNKDNNAKPSPINPSRKIQDEREHKSIFDSIRQKWFKTKE